MIKEISYDKLSNIIIDFESGDISMKDTMYLFQELVDTGLLWEMTENYRKLASKLAEQGLIDVR